MDTTVAYPETRSMNADFQKGLRDKSQVTDTPDRGGSQVSAPTAPIYRAARRYEAGKNV